MAERFGRRLLAEACGSALLAATVIGSGIMAQRLAGGNVAIALLANTGATVAVLAVLITLFAPVGGAHFNPAVTFTFALLKRITWRSAAGYVVVQIAGCLTGALLAHAMFALPLAQVSTHVRNGPAQMLSEGVATFGLLLVILGSRRPRDAPWLISAWIGAAYWFTASTCFANPAITIARALTNTFAGIRPADVPAFVAAQTVGAIVGLCMAHALFNPRKVRSGARTASTWTHVA